MTNKQGKTMGGVRYELLKCDACGKTFGYVHESVKVFPPKGVDPFDRWWSDSKN